jgi:hypothetical protein
MTETEIQCLKDNIDRAVKIETTDGERLIAKVLLVTHDEEHDEHDLLYEVIFSNTPEFYANRANSGGFVLDFSKIVSVRSLS